MATIEHLLKVYPQVFDAISTYGFYNAILFKGFSPAEAHNFNLSLQDHFTATTESIPQTTRQLNLHDKLSELLHCHIVLTMHDELESYCVNNLNESNAVQLTQDAPRQLLESAFGIAWPFNQEDNRAICWLKPR